MKRFVGLLAVLLGLAACSDHRAVSIPTPSPPAPIGGCPPGAEVAVRPANADPSVTVNVGALVEATADPGAYPTSNSTALVAVCVRRSAKSMVTVFRAQAPGRVIVSVQTNAGCGPCNRSVLTATVVIVPRKPV